MEEPVSQHDELERCDRALDRIFDHVDHHAATLPGAQMLSKIQSPFDRVKVMDRLVPLMFLQARSHLGAGLCARGNHEKVVMEDAPIHQLDPVVVRLDHVGCGLD